MFREIASESPKAMILEMVGFFKKELRRCGLAEESFQGAERENVLRKQARFGGERESGTQVVQA
jgi:hypothetical protein